MNQSGKAENLTLPANCVRKRGSKDHNEEQVISSTFHRNKFPIDSYFPGFKLNITFRGRLRLAFGVNGV